MMMFNEEKSSEIKKYYEGDVNHQNDSTGDSTSCQIQEVTTLWELLLNGCKISGDGRCLGYRNNHSGYSYISYSELIKRAKRFGSGVVNKGILSGQLTKIGVYAKNCVEWLVAEYGSFTQSMIIVPLYDTLGPNSCSFIINHADIQMVVCDSESKARNILKRHNETPGLRNIVMMQTANTELRQLAKENGIQLDSLKDIEDLGEEKPTGHLLPRSSDVSVICYTSGTTGDPKGVVLTHKNMVSATISLRKRSANLNKDDILISYLPLSHIYEQLSEAIMFLVGGSLGFFSGDVSQLVEDMRVLQPTFFPAVPRILNRLYDKAQDLFASKGIINNSQPQGSSESTEIRKRQKSAVEIALYKAFLGGLGGKVRIVLSGGAPISNSVLDFYRTGLGCQVMEVYGQTECAGPCCLNIVSDDARGSVGTPIPGCVVKLVDVPDMGYFSVNKQGEVCIKGPNVFKGYFKDPQKTLATLDKDGWLHTGDIGMWLSNDQLKIVDRKQHIFKLSQGEYLSPEKIENVYSISKYISQIFVCGDSLKSYLVAIVIPHKEAVLPWWKNKSDIESWNEVCKQPAVKQLILEDMTRLGKDAALNGIEKVKKIHLHPEVLTLEDGFLTPTMKAKREVWRKHFAKEIADLYKSKE